jgi:Fe-S-cluster containining protein
MTALDPQFRPRLRNEVSNHRTELCDGLTGAAYPLNELARQIVDVIDGQLTFIELLPKVVRGGAIDPAQVERELRQLLLLGLLEGTCGSFRDQLERIRTGERLPPLVLEGSRFGCQGSGACCRGYVFGPVSEQEKVRIESLDPRKALPQLGLKPLFVAAGSSSGKPTYQLATSNEACVFLEHGSRCGLHRAFGPAAKPALCQLYPLAAVATIAGLKVYDRGECATFAVSTKTGEFLGETIPKIRALVNQDLYHPTATLDEFWRCDYGAILALARRLDDEARLNPPLQALHVIGRVTRGFILSLTQCPIETGQPEAVIAAMLSHPASEFRTPDAAVAANASIGLSRLSNLSWALGEQLAPTENLASAFTESASVLSEICEDVLNQRPMSERAKAATAVVMGSEVEQPLTLSLRHMLFGRELLLDDHLSPGLLRMALVLLLAMAGARLRALDEGAGAVSARHLSFSHMVTKRKLNRPGPYMLLRASGEQAWPILDALPLLARKLSC